MNRLSTIIAWENGPVYTATVELISTNPPILFYIWKPDHSYNEAWHKIDGDWRALIRAPLDSPVRTFSEALDVALAHFIEIEQEIEALLLTQP